MIASLRLGTAIVTGASSGIGAIYADRFARRGYDVILVARRRDRLQSVAERLRTETGREMTTLVADLNNRAHLARVEDVLRSNTAITMLVNNAGFGSAIPLLEADISKMEEMIGLNVTALTRLTYAAVPGFIARGGGTIINIASIVGIAPEFLNGVYGGTKAFVIAFSRSLHYELAQKGLRVQVVLPGATATEFWDIAGRPMSKLESERVINIMSAADMVDASFSGLDQREFMTIPSLPNAADLASYEAARQVLIPNLSHATPAARYTQPTGKNSSPLWVLIGAVETVAVALSIGARLMSRAAIRARARHLKVPTSDNPYSRK
jgi:short-subunit dehydrogenase